MGVLGLTPFLHKTCPEVVRTLPNRLRELSGKTVAVDGTLITQRLHFSPTPHRHRHVLGWHRIMKELMECDVRAICVFDGKERSLAKELEMERRRHVRRLTAARGTLELERLERLRKLAGLLQILRTMSSSAKDQIVNTLRETMSISHDSQFHPPTVPSWLPAVEPWRIVKESELPKHIIGNFITPHEVFGKLDNSDVSEVLRRDTAATFVTAYASNIEESRGSESETRSVGDSLQAAQIHEVELDKDDIAHEHGTDEDVLDDEHEAEDDTLDEQNGDDTAAPEPSLSDKDCAQEQQMLSQRSPALSLDPTTPPKSSLFGDLKELSAVDEDVAPRMTATEAFRLEASYTIPPPDPKEIPAALASLYFQFRQSVPKLAALPSTTPAIMTAETVSEQERVALQDEEQTVHAMSKRQNELTSEEGDLWGHLSDAQPSGLGADTIEHELAALAEKSNVISQSYERRTHPPTAETYEESKQILRAMGVPCIDSTGPFEAEALAASLVLNGYADYVASEDTDVLIYEAPLIRNIANRHGPLVLMSGTDVRATLQLDRDSFIDFALLLGTDFSQRIKNVGPARALRFIRAHGSIERMLQCEPRYPPRVDLPTYLAQVSLARAVFQTLPPIPASGLFQPSEYDEDQVIRILGTYGLHREAMEEFDHTSALSGNMFSDNPCAL